MPSPEHDFVTSAFLETAAEMARSEIYAYTEAERQRFDFACLLTQHKERAVIGQTLRSHASGIEKDLNWLLLDNERSVPVYLYSDTASHVSRIGEVLSNARHRLDDRVSLLRLYSFPIFDADDEGQRLAVQTHIRDKVVDDLLMNVLFGRLAKSDIDLFLNGVGIPGLLIAALETIGTEGFTNFPGLGRSIGINPSTVRPRVFSLLSAGMLKTRQGASVYYLTQRGRVFLRIAALLDDEAPLGVEARFILDRLGLVDDDDGDPEEDRDLGPFSGRSIDRLRSEIAAAGDGFGIFVSGGPYADDPRGHLAPGAFDHLGWVER